MKNGIKYTLIAVGLLLLLITAGTLVKVVFFPAHVADKAVDTAYDVVDKTLNANNALTNYESFKDLYNGAKQQVANIESTEDQMDNLGKMYGDPKTWEKDIRSDYDFLVQNLEGFKMQYQSLIKQYNSDSSKLNRSLFKDTDLPAELPIDHNKLP